MNHQHQPDPHADESTIADAWQQQLAQASTNPTLAATLRQAPPTLYRRFARAYRGVLALSRGQRRRLVRRLGLPMGGAALAFALALGQVPPAHAATISVGGSCTLVDAITAANTDTATGGCVAGSGPDTLTLSGNVTLTAVNNGPSYSPNGLPLITSAITIAGNGFTIARDAGAPDFRILMVTSAGNLTLNDTTISGGNLLGSSSGISNDGTLTLNTSTVSGNTARSSGSAGGIFNGGTATLNNSTVSGNTAGTTAGGINNSGTLTLNNSTVSGNTAGQGSGINNSYTGTATLNNTLVSGNSDGGIRNLGALTLNNSTVSGNTADYQGGGIYNVSGLATLHNSTVSGNTASVAGGGIANRSTLTLDRSLLSGNTAASGAELHNNAGFPPFFPPGTITAANYNVFGHSGETNAQAFVNFAPSGSDITATSNGTTPTALTAILDTTLQNNGGPTLTHALVPGSPAVDAAPSGPATDQRGVSRPQGTAFDSGAFELEQAAGADLSVAVSDSSDPTSVGDTYTYVVTVTNNGPTSATSVSAVTTLSGASATILSASTAQGSCTASAPTVTCALGTLTNAASATITITVEPNATGTVTASASVSATEADPTGSNNSASQSTTVTNAHGCTITGTPGNDTLTGTNGADIICGLGGNDTIHGGNGSDIIYAGSGNDLLQGGNSDDTLYAGPGDDSSYGETLLGLLDNGSDTIYGGPGNDMLDGGNGDDTVTDTQGTDSLSGSAGNDTIVTQDGVGGDTANGGLGTDTCTVDGADTTSGC